MAGYDWSKGKSNNAVWAEEEEGMRTKSKITAKWLREGGITEKVGFVKFLIKADRIMATEWHHTSKYFNETSYYSTEDIAEQLENLSPIWREIYADPKLRNSSKRDIRRAFRFKNACERYNSSDADIFDVCRGVVLTWLDGPIIENFTITIDWPGGQIIAKTFMKPSRKSAAYRLLGLSLCGLGPITVNYQIFIFMIINLMVCVVLIPAGVVLMMHLFDASQKMAILHGCQPQAFAICVSILFGH